ncbi:Ig-like domain-containing protein, partial [Hyalangium rubrum]
MNVDVVVYREGLELGRVGVNASGAYAFELDRGFEGLPQLWVAAEFQGVQSNRFHVSSAGPSNNEPEPEPPTSPTISMPAEGQFVSGRRPEVRGTVEQRAAVSIVVTVKNAQGQVSPGTTVKQGGDWTHTLTSDLADGSYSILAEAVENRYRVPAPVVTFTVDGTPPTTTVTGPVGHVSSTSATFVFSSNEAPNVSYECQLDDETAFTACPASSFSGLSQGLHVLKVRAKDRANNVDASPAEHSWTVDTLLPTTTVTGPVGHVSSDSATFVFSSNEAPNVSYECQLDDETAFTACPAPPVFNELGEGLHVLKVRAKDRANNVDASPAEHSWTVDTLLPTTTVTGPVGHISSDSATFVFSSNEAPNVSYECQLDDETAFTACPAPPVFNELG